MVMRMMCVASILSCLMIGCGAVEPASKVETAAISPVVFLGSGNSCFHRAGCGRLPSRAKAYAETDAVQAGYAPCKECMASNELLEHDSFKGAILGKLIDDQQQAQPSDSDELQAVSAVGSHQVRASGQAVESERISQDYSLIQQARRERQQAKREGAEKMTVIYNTAPTRLPGPTWSYGGSKYYGRYGYNY